MSLELHDNATFDGSIGIGGSETLEVQTTTADFVEVLIDDGTTGSAPDSYDITVEHYSTVVDDYMQADSVTGVTAFSPAVTKDARGQNYRITVTNQSGGPANYRISLEAFRET